MWTPNPTLLALTVFLRIAVQLIRPADHDLAEEMLMWSEEKFNICASYPLSLLGRESWSKYDNQRTK
jgi:hypothetical protein